MKKIFAILCLICPHILLASEIVKIDNLLYRITDSIAEVSNYTWEEGDRLEYSGDVHIPSRIYHDGRTYLVTKVGMGAFRQCHQLTSVSMSEGIEEIDTMAFYDCRSMLSVQMPSTLRAIHVGAFSCCKQLCSVAIPDSVVYIGGGAFAQCVRLQYVHFPMKYVEKDPLVPSIFYGDISIKHVIQTSNVLYFVPQDIEGEYMVAEGIKAIAAHSFMGCTRITKVVLPSSLVTIGYGAFCGCASLKEINMPDALRHVGFKAFDGCVGLKKPLYNSTIFFHLPPSVGGHLTIPRGIRYIRSYACAENHKLRSVSIPQGVRCVPHSIFFGNDHLRRVRIPASVDTISFHRGISLGPVREIRNTHHFAYLRPTQKGHYKIPKGTKVIEYCALQSCTLVDSITIPSSVESIRSYALNHCLGLRAISIPSSVRSLGYNVFANCSNLTTIRLESPIPPSVEHYEIPFDELEEWELHQTDLGVPDSISIIVPKGSAYAYRSAPVWKLFNIDEE